MPAGTKLMLLAPLVQNRKGEHRELLADAQKRGFARARIDGRVRGLEEPISLDKKSKHDIELVVDRLVLKPDLRAASPTRWRPRSARARACCSSPTRPGAEPRTG